jgi:hypothetical protein
MRSFLYGMEAGAFATIAVLYVWWRLDPREFYSRKDRAIIAYFYDGIDELLRLRAEQLPSKPRPLALWARLVLFGIAAFGVLVAIGIAVEIYLGK